MQRKYMLKWMGTVALTLAVGLNGFSAAEENSLAQQKDTASEPPLYFVAQYDPQRDPAKDLAEALRLANKEKKHVLLQVGGDWCGWCRIMTDYFHDTKTVRASLSKNYVIMKVNYSSDNKNDVFLSAYPKVPAFPHLFVLDGKGKLLCSQYTGDLEDGGSYSEENVLGFLNKWTPAAVATAASENDEQSAAPSVGTD